MTPGEVTAWLTSEFGNDSAAKVVVISRLTNAAGERVELAVVDVSFDESDREIHLLVNHPPWDDRNAEDLSVASFLVKLAGLPPSSGSGRFVSGTWTELDEEHTARVDWPLEGVATKEDGSCVAFVERSS